MPIDTDALVPWRATLAPLGVPSEDGRTISRQIAIMAAVPLSLTLQEGADTPTRLIGRVDIVTVDHAADELVAYGHVDPTVPLGATRTVGDALRAGDLCPSVYVDTPTFHAGELVSARVVQVLAVPSTTALWPGRVAFSLEPARP